MYTGNSIASASSSMMGGPVTPCPPSFGQNNPERTHSLVPSQASLSSGLPRSNAVRELGSSSRLPLKAQHTGAATVHSNAGQSYAGLGLGHRANASGTASLFSPPALASLQNRQQAVASKPSFRPRPSIASVATTASSQGSSTSWAGLRMASSATSVDSGC